ncbi:MAG: hypothetical protein ACRDJ9_12765 [Dehalococcoidia bacterium]
MNTTGRLLSFGLGYPLGAIVAGTVSETAGPRAALLAMAAIPAAGAIAAWLSPLRGYELEAPYQQK